MPRRTSYRNGGTMEKTQREARLQKNAPPMNLPLFKYQKCLELYMAGTPMKKIAEDEGVNLNTLNNWRVKKKWSKKKKELIEKVSERSADTLAKFMDDQTNRLTRKAVHSSLKLIERVDERINHSEQIDELKDASVILKNAHHVGHKALGLDKQMPAKKSINIHLIAGEIRHMQEEIDHPSIINIDN